MSSSQGQTEATCAYCDGWPPEAICPECGEGGSQGQTERVRAEWRLCYVDGSWAWFAEDFDKAWGDDWNDAPHFCNAGDPYHGRDGDGRYFRVAFDGKAQPFGVSGLNDPLGIGDGWYSVQQFNAREVPWLCEIAYGTKPVKRVNEIWGGCTYDEFCVAIAAAEGTVYVPASHPSGRPR